MAFVGVAVSISLGVLLILLAFLLICMCYERDKACAKMYYVLDENGIKRMPARGADAGFFKRLSNTGVLRPNFRFSTSTLQKHPDQLRTKSGDRELMDSLDVDKHFSNSVLQIDACEKRSCADGDDWRSCISGAATRRSSVDSIRSAVSDPGYFTNVAIV